MQTPPPAKWDETVDIVVVGSGFAGLAAAIEAKQSGCSVVILEKMKGFGGNSVISDGVIAAAGTPEQAAAGIDDSAERMGRDMLRAGLGLNHPGLVQVVAERSGEVLRWTQDYLGVRYLPRIDQFGGHSVPRCLSAPGRSGAAIIKPLLAKVNELGMKIRTRVLLEHLVCASDGTVRGAAVREGYAYPDPASGSVRRIGVKRAVILATGGFGNDVEFRAGQDPRLTAAVGSTNKFSTTADGLKAALRIGALPVHLACIQLGPWACPDEKGYGIGPDFASYIAFPYGILVDPDTGDRFVNELGDRKLRADAILSAGHPCVAVVDAGGVARSGYAIDHCLRRGVVRQFSTIETLAEHHGIPVAALRHTIAVYNKSVAQKVDARFGKPILPTADPLQTPPFYGMRVWPKVHHTMGGVLINAQAQVLDLSQRPIPGLYAAGEVAGGVHGACRLGSCAITDCLVFGRIAGQTAARGRRNTPD